MLFKFVDKLPRYDTSEVFFVRLNPSIQSADELIKTYKYVLWFPGWAGSNWNAFLDCMSDFYQIPYSKVVVYHEVIPNIDSGELRIYLEVLIDALLRWKDFKEDRLDILFHVSNKEKILEIIGDYGMEEE